MEEHLLISFINPRMQFGDLKYQTAVESQLFDTKNQEIINKINDLFQKHISLFKMMRQNNLLEDHINALACNQILGTDFREKKLVSNLFITKFEKLFDSNSYDLAQATIQFKNHIGNVLKNLNLKDTALEELLNDQSIPLQFDLEETKQFMQKQSWEEQFSFIRNYILYNLSNNENFIQNLKLWKRKFGIQNDDKLKSNISIQVHFLDWSEQVKHIIEKLWMPYTFKQGEYYLADVNDNSAFKPLKFVSDIYDKKKANFFIIDSLSNLIKNHNYNYNQIKVAFSHKSPKEVLISFLEILDWCKDILKWEEIICRLVENIKKEYLTISSYQDSQGDGGFSMEIYLETILNDIINQFEDKVDQINKQKFIDINILDESNIGGNYYEITNDGIDFYNEEYKICGNVVFSVEKKGMIGKIGQMIMDVPQIQRMYLKINKEQNKLKYFQILWQCKNLKNKMIKLILFRIGQLIATEIQKQERQDKEIEIYF
ncbi:unnamed protein product [Paramecium sonneborni]|uniref:Uncharacterized protein n=1 Tax=Paramecium sonneborni TaxID=65129 RepID=A0A8S1R544_9CILI|nr:unnamed protein product [Paramecium sonneborni]